MPHQSATCTSASLRLVSYNIRKCVGLDQVRRPERILNVINETGADIVALQEADRRLGVRPAALSHEAIRGGSDLVPLSLAPNSRSLGWHGNALLVRQGFAVDAVHRLDLPSLEPRGALVADLHWRGRGLRVVAVHLGLLRRDRLRQLQHIAEWLQARPFGPTVILGDFNDWSQPRATSVQLPGFAMAIPGRSFHSVLRLAALDRIAASAGVQLNASGVHVSDLSRRASDHLPVWADVTLVAAAAPA